MQNTSSTFPSRPAGSNWQITWRGRLLIVAGMLLVLAWGFWYNEHRTIGWGQTVNPMYWYHRYRGDDLYDPEDALLMHGNRDLPEVAITFDDGPHIGSLGEILDTLQRYGAHATFFDVGKRMMQNPSLLRRTLAEGHEVGNHTFHHYRLDTLSPRLRHREVNDTDITFYRITGQHLHLLRPPGMRYNDDILMATRQLGYVVVGYTTASNDFDLSETPDYIANRTLRRTENGSIILLHDYPGTAAALPEILETLRSEGYRFVTISEMLAHLPMRQRSDAERFVQAHRDDEVEPAGALPTASASLLTRRVAK